MKEAETSCLNLGRYLVWKIEGQHELTAQIVIYLRRVGWNRHMCRESKKHRKKIGREAQVRTPPLSCRCLITLVQELSLTGPDKSPYR